MTCYRLVPLVHMSDFHQNTCQFIQRKTTVQTCLTHKILTHSVLLSGEFKKSISECFWVIFGSHFSFWIPDSKNRFLDSKKYEKSHFDNFIEFVLQKYPRVQLFDWKVQKLIENIVHGGLGFLKIKFFNFWIPKISENYIKCFLWNLCTILHKYTNFCVQSFCICCSRVKILIW